MLARCDASEAQAWRDALVLYCDGTPGVNFMVVDAGEISSGNLQALVSATASTSQTTQGEQEWCLQMLTPLPFHREKNAPRTAMDAATFLRSISNRVNHLFGARVNLVSFAPQLQIIAHLWRYNEVPHASHSQKGHTQFYAGCAGPLYLRADATVLAGLLPWLRLGEIWHFGGSNEVTALGYGALQLASPPYFDAQLLDASAMAQCALQSMRENDLDSITRDAATEAEVDGIHHALADRVTHALGEQSWAVKPRQAFFIPKPGGESRLVERLESEDFIVERRLLDLLAPRLDALFSQASHAYRSGRSRESAANTVREYIRQGYRAAVETDIESFFPSVNLLRLRELLNAVLPLGDHITRGALWALLNAGYVVDGKLLPRERGLAQGSPLSPLLANLFLTTFDENMLRQGAAMVRYGDDLVILCRDKSAAERMLRESESTLAHLGLSINREKTAIRDVQTGFVFLGERFDTQTALDPLTASLPHKKPLLITEPFLMLAVNGDALDIRRDDKLVDTIPLRRLSEIIVLGRTGLSTTLIEKCARFGISLSIALESGYQIGTFSPDSRAYHAIAFRQGQHHATLSDTERLALASSFVVSKIRNYRHLVHTRYQAGSNVLLHKLDRTIESLSIVATLDQARGHEGHAAREVFAWLNGQIIDPAMRARRRERGAGDRLNSMLNFGYYLSYTRLNGLVRAHGLNPYLGFLHETEENFETVVADLQELFRAHVDALVLRLVNTRVITPTDFEERTKGLWLTRQGARTFALHFEREMNRRVGRATVRDWMIAQVRALRRWTSDGGAFWLYEWSREAALKTANEPDDEDDESSHNSEPAV